jgi:TolB-like protein/class 3 adenylate cyclase/Tfp pilus assembly protein PilF
MPHPGNEQRKLAAIMFTDMVGFTALAQRDDGLALELLEEHRRLVRAALLRNAGQEIKTIGDAFLVEFDSARGAVNCAIEIQRAIAERNRTEMAGRQIAIRIGIHVGDVVHRDGDVLGDGVNIAERVRSVAEPGGICLTQQVRDQVGAAVDLPLFKLGSAELKHVHARVALYGVVMPWAKSRSPFLARFAFRLGQRRRLALAAAWALGLVLVGWLAWQVAVNQRPTVLPERGSRIEAPKRTRIVVLPFANYSPEPKDEYFADGVTEQLTTALANIEGLEVIARTSAMRYKSKGLSVGEIAEELGVGSVLEGSVRVIGERARITAQLIDTATQSHLWADDYEYEFKDVFAIQSRVADRVADALSIRLLEKDRERLSRHATDNPEAFRLYLQGRFEVAKGTKAGFEQGVALFQRAITLDERYALAHAGLADAYISAADWHLPAREVMPRARAAAGQALTLDSLNAEAHLALGKVNWLFDWDQVAAEVEYAQAIFLAPRDAQLCNEYATFLWGCGKTNDAARQRALAVSLDPHSPFIQVSVGFDLLAAGRPDEAIRQAQKLLAVDANSFAARNLLGQAYGQKQMYAEAITELQKSRDIDDGPDLIALQGYYEGRSGRTAEAQRLFAELERFAATRVVPAYFKALIHLGLGETERSWAYLTEAARERSIYLAQIETSPLWEPVTRQPRFAELRLLMQSPP